MVGDEAKEFVNLCVLSVTRLAPPNPISMASHVSIWPASLGKGSASRNIPIGSRQINVNSFTGNPE